MLIYFGFVLIIKLSLPYVTILAKRMSKHLYIIKTLKFSLYMLYVIMIVFVTTAQLVDVYIVKDAYIHIYVYCMFKGKEKD